MKHGSERHSDAPPPPRVLTAISLRALPAIAHWSVAALISWCCACQFEDDRSETSRVAKVRKLPDAALAVEPGGAIEVALQALDAEGDGVDELRVYFATSSPKLVIDGSGATTAIVTTRAGELSGVSGRGLAVAAFRAAPDATPGSVWLFGYLLADAGDEAAADRLPALGVQTFEVEVKAPSE